MSDYKISPIEKAKFSCFMGMKPEKIPHWEHWSNPDAETYLTGINYYERPKDCRTRLKELYPQLDLTIPETNEPIKRPDSDNVSDATVRWGDSQTGHWDFGKIFNDAEDVFKFSPLEHADFSDMEVVEQGDFSSEEIIFNRYRKNFPKEWVNAPTGSTAAVGFYNTMFMWPLLTFGWELFLEVCLDDRFERIMDEFAEINRRVFKAFARLPVNFVTCHDDIVTTRGPVCSPAWMNKYIFPRYEEYWGYLKDSGKKIIYMVDGCADQYVDNIMACGASGIISEPYTDYKAIAKRYKNPFLAGEGDNRILQTADKTLIHKMVDNMIETSKMSDGYMMCIGNHIPWNVPGEGIKIYLDYSNDCLSKKQ